MEHFSEEQWAVLTAQLRKGTREQLSSQNIQMLITT